MMEKLFLLLLLGLALIDAHDIHEPDEDKRTAQCRSFSDPNIITFDESYYQFHLEGDHFILFDDLKDTRVTVGYEKSGASSTRNCAVYVKKGRRLVFVDFCAPASPLLAASKLYGVWVQKNRVGLDSIRESPQCVPMSASDEDSERAWTHVPKYLGNFKCARVQAGSSYDTYVIRTYEHRFDETVKVRVQMSGRQLVDVRVEAPATSFNNTGGLCGKWDESAARELFVLDRDGVEHYVDHSSPDDLQLIGEFWKLHSRYNKDAEETKRKRCPECYVMAERSFYCPCDDFDLFDITNYNIEKPDRETYCKVPMGMCLHKYLERNTTCYAPTTTSILTTTTSAGESATSQSWVQTTANDIDDETTEEAFAGTTSQPSQTTGQPDHSEEGELIDHTEEEGTVTPSSGTTTTKTPGISRPQAAEMCTYAILQNPTIEYFIVNGYLNVDFNVDVCINDAVASQDEDVTDSHVAFIKDEIISLLLDGSLNVTFADISDEIIAGLCPKDCNQNGDCRLDAQCLDSVSEECLSPVKCYCEEPYGGRDCSQDLTQIAPLTLDRTCCDLRHEHCSYVTGSGCSYETDDTIYVKIELIEMGVDSTNTIVKYTTADRHSIQQLGIHVIGLSELALFANIHGLETDFQAVESTAQLNIYISYLNSSFGSTYSSITLYDSLCRECDQQNGATDVLPDRCDIDGVCRKRNDTQPDNVELVCEPDVDRFNWTYRPTPDPLCPNGYYWSTANLDDPSGDGDLELYGLFGSRYGCREPLVTIIETASDHTPYNETGQVLHVEDCYGFMCLNRENTEPCLDYQIRRCCPIVGTTSEQPEETTAVEPETTAAVEPETTAAVEPETTAAVEPETTTELLTSAYPTTTTTEKKLPIDCYELWLEGERDNGYYQIQPEHHRHGIHVYCDMEDGGWTVVLNRIPDDEHEHLDEKNEPHYFFDRDLDEYKSGFGEARRNFWLGLRPLHSILAQSSRTELRVSVGNRRIGERVSNNNNNKNEGHGHHHTHHAYYSRFTLADAHDDYEMRLGEKYAGELVDVSQPMSGRVFSTRDHDLTDNDCPEENRSGWWFDDESCWAKGMCLTCKHRHYYNGNDHRNHPSNYDDYEYIQMAIKSLRSA